VFLFSFGGFLPFLPHAFPEAPSAVPCGGAVGGGGHVRHGAAPAASHRSHPAAPCQPLGTSTEHKMSVVPLKILKPKRLYKNFMFTFPQIFGRLKVWKSATISMKM